VYPVHKFWHSMDEGNVWREDMYEGLEAIDLFIT